MSDLDIQQKDKQYVWHPFTHLKYAEIPVQIVKGEGAFFYDVDGNKLLDAISSWWVNLHGHCHPYISQKISEQLHTLEHAIFSSFTHEPAVILAERLIGHLPENQSKIFYSDNGSTAVEVGLKMVLQYWHNQESSKKKFIAFENAYHGDTFGGMSVGARNVFNNAFENLLLLATNAKHSAWGIAFNESQRLAIEADQTWKDNNEQAGINGMKAARSIALLSYRTPFGYNSAQTDEDDITDGFKAASYQQYQGEKLTKRFNAFSYYSITKTMDSHNVGRGKPSIQSALKSIKAKTTVVGISTDILFPPTDQIFLSKNINGANYIGINSDLGHDGFLTESEKIGEVIRKLL